jgi:hypothetical protein
VAARAPRVVEIPVYFDDALAQRSTLPRAAVVMCLRRKA